MTQWRRRRRGRRQCETNILIGRRVLIVPHLIIVPSRSARKMMTNRQAAQHATVDEAPWLAWCLMPGTRREDRCEDCWWLISLVDALCLSERLFPLAQPEPAVYYSSLAWRNQQQGPGAWLSRRQFGVCTCTVGAKSALGEGERRGRRNLLGQGFS